MDSKTLGTAWVSAWLRSGGEVVSLQRDMLNGLDRAIGDADHGENLDRGFRAVVQNLDAPAPGPAAQSPGAGLRLAAMTLLSNVGGAAGPLYGTAFLRAAAVLGDTVRIDSAMTAELIAAARNGIAERGRAVVGDKTMIDAWNPAAEAAAQAAVSGRCPAGVLRAAAQAARAGAESTDGLIAHKGRASYLAERSVGHRDPGAVSSALILTAAADAAVHDGARCSAGGAKEGRGR